MDVVLPTYHLFSWHLNGASSPDALYNLIYYNFDEYDFAKTLIANGSPIEERTIRRAIDDGESERVIQLLTGKCDKCGQYLYNKKTKI